jgi:hypothetical protein
MKTIHSYPASLRAIGLAACVLFAVSACAGGPSLPDDPFDSDEPGLTMVPINHTDRYALNVVADKYWAGDARPHNDGSAAACCYPGLKDWNKPVTVRWTWGTEVDPKTKAVLKPREPHSMVAYFPPGGPKRSAEDIAQDKDEPYLCVILRNRDTAELAFSWSGTGCATK